jgi:XTP/dITP diphosphohydrolase
MQKLIFATNNLHKLEEIQDLLQSKYDIISLGKIGIKEDIPETADTLEGNALQKARFVYKRTQSNCFADDTGLEVDALEGAPGVYSARYAGENATFDDNMDKLLASLVNKENRKARFRTVIALIINGNEYLFEGKIDGTILLNKKGTDGFGYDPIFLPEGFEKSFAEMEPAQKNAISHRGRSVVKLVHFLESFAGNN